MSEVVLNAELREASSKNARRIRSEGIVPGVFYGHGEVNMNIQVSLPNLAQLIYSSKTHIINLQVSDGTAKKCILRDVQFDPVSDKPVHFDLQGLKENEKLTVQIPIVLVGGIPKGVRDGGLLQHVLHKVKVSCLPKDIPEKVEVNVADLEMNRSVHVSDLLIPNVTILENPGSTVVGVLPPTVVKEEVPAEAPAETVQEPEVLSKGKKPEEGEEDVKETKETKK
jgi:large subunit ribosomal protein L25